MRRLECLVCGRKISEGQGITLSRGTLALHFHSSRCASKFLRSLFEALDDSCVASIERVAKELERAKEKRKIEKKI